VILPALAAGLALLRRVGVPLGVGAWVLLIILTAPTVMFMQLMLTSVSLYWACLWVCAWSAFTKRWWIFIPTFFVAIGTRQSALLWLALPGWVVAMEIWKTGGRISRIDWGQTRGPLLSGIMGFAAFLAFKWGMNETFAQRHYAAAMKELPGAGALFWIGPAFLLCRCGWGGWLMTLLRRERPSAHRMMIGAVLTLLADALAVHGYSLLSLTHHLVRDPWAKPMLALTGAVGGWGLSGSSRVWVPAIMAGIAGMIPQWLYVSGFDYYYIESFFLGFIASICGMAVAIHPSRGKGAFGLSRALAVVSALILLVWHGRCWVRHKLMQDSVSAFTEIYEKATREGLLAQDEIGTAPFGYIGWRLDPYYMASGGGDPGAFNHLIQGWDGKEGIGVVAEYPKRVKKYRDWLPSKNNTALRALPDSTLLTEIKVPLLWRYTAHYRMKKVPIAKPRPGFVKIDPALYEYHPFPLNDDEWRQLMNRSPGEIWRPSGLIPVDKAR
jgi:hypothetical protein